MRLTGAQIIMECLLEQKVDTVFGYPGGAVLNIYDALYEYQDRINHVCTAHEQGAAHAADGYARASGKTGVCIATSGPGATNLVTGIATAYMDSVPMVAITGNVNLNLLGLDSFQEVDITGITMPVTKHNFIVKKIEDLADTIRHAFRIANEGRKGPVLVDIPKDITGAVCEFTPRDVHQPFDEAQERRQHLPVSKPLPKPKETKLEAALELISKSQRPFLYGGGGVIASGCEEEFAAFAEKIDAPVATSLMCQGGYDQSSGRYMGMLGMHGTMTSAQALKNCDLFIAVGTRFSDRVLCNSKLFARHCPIIQIDIDPAEFDKQIDISVKLGGDAKEILQILLDRCQKEEHTEWMAEIAEWKSLYPLHQTPVHPGAVTPQALMETLRSLTDDQDILTTEVGQHQMWAAQFYEFRKPRTFLTSGGLGTMGYGLGAAIGAKYACPEQRVINIAGDGSFHMNCNELSTAAKYNVPIVEIVVNNEVLGMVRQWQKLFYDKRYSSTTMEKPTDYEKLAEAFGVKGYTIRKQEELEPVLREALSQDGPVLVNCVIDKDINVLPMVPAGKSAEEPLLEI
ncbi:MAG: biosynthetic-type acetolactate synthase large subunit [Oscillospiraceae bacterium]|nr:biosynthetic-type acetolactate synthase large subunit [Oscillospiraceae bacterium]